MSHRVRIMVMVFGLCWSMESEDSYRLEMLTLHPVVRLAR